jgi:peptide/nickel transport system substrate-binding protein
VQNTSTSNQLLEVQRQPNTVALDLSPLEASTLDKSKLNIFGIPSTELWYIGLNQDPKISPITVNRDFRQAVRYGIDYKALLDIAGVGSAQAPGLVPTSFLGGLPPTASITRDVTKAKAALASSGITNATIDFTYGTGNGPAGVSFDVIAQKIQANLQEIGITVNLKPTASVIFGGIISKGTGQMILNTGGPAGFNPQSYLVWAPGKKVATFVRYQLGANPALDAIAAQAQVATADAQRADLMIKFQNAINDDAVFIPLLHAGLVMVASKSVGGLNGDGVPQGVFFSQMT